MNGDTAGRPLRILIVDDEVFTLKALTRILRTHQVTVAASGEEALEAFTQSGPFDVILCDVMMPGMTGPDVYKALAVQSPGTERRIVFISGGAFGMEILEFLDQVENRLVAKPFDRAELAEVVQEVVDREGPAH